MKTKDTRSIDQYTEAELKEIIAEREVWVILAEAKDRHGTAAEYSLTAKLAREVLKLRFPEGT